MAQTSKWELHIGKKIHIISGEEAELILGAGDNRFVRFRDLVINPSFVTQMILLTTDSLQLPAPDESELDSEEWLAKRI